MEPLSLIYRLKIGLGALAALLCVALKGIFVNDVFGGAALSILVYAISDRILRQIFIEKVEKPSVVTKTGWGIYIITWLFFWILIFTILNPTG